MLEALDQGLAERISGPPVFADTGVFTAYAKTGEASQPRRQAAALTSPLAKWIESIWRASPRDAPRATT